jgi:hypothetical protein
MLDPITSVRSLNAVSFAVALILVALLLAIIDTVAKAYTRIQRERRRTWLKTYQKNYGFNTPGFGAFLNVQYSPTIQ